MSGYFQELPDGTVLHEPPNNLLRIDQVWAFVAVDEDGNEGVCAAPFTGMGVVPLIAADEARLASILPVAQRIATMSGRTVKLIKLSVREELQVFHPEKQDVD
jgi:hypothetical protein